MSPEQYSRVEQDFNIPKGGDELPTYDDLAVQGGPNSRFGRWKGWIEKRAAERYNDITPEERQRRRERGWGNEDHESHSSLRAQRDIQGSSRSTTPHIISIQPTPRGELLEEHPAALIPGLSPSSPSRPHFQDADRSQSPLMHLHIETENLSISNPHVDEQLDDPQALPPLPFVSQSIPPTHLKLNNFGSRFLPHTTSPIRCLLPLMSDQLVLIGHDEGLSVLDMFPQQWTETGSIVVKGPDEATVKTIWKGESVHQMNILELENVGDDTPQGVILFLIGPVPDSSPVKDPDSFRSIRMYNLASLINLARWAISRKGAPPLELHKPSHWHSPQSSPRKHKQHGSIARSLRSLTASSSLPPTEADVLYHHLVPSPSSPLVERRDLPADRFPPRQETNDSTWDFIEDQPLRWATDYVSLATPGSRLSSSSVISYALWADPSRKGKGGELLAVATKNNIMLYETLKGERAFRFVKEFYTPLHPRSITFFQQSAYNGNGSKGGIENNAGLFNHHAKSENTHTIRALVDPTRNSMLHPMMSFGKHLSLFVVFDKKAGWIRLVDSAVGELELCDLPGTSAPPQSLFNYRESMSSPRGKTRLSFESHSSSTKWIPLVIQEIPGWEDNSISSNEILLFTKGKRTHILPSPLPANSAQYPPLHILNWKTVPKVITSRVCDSDDSTDGEETGQYLQVIGFCDYGLEIQELPILALGGGKSKGKGKGKARTTYEEFVQAEEDFGGETGFLCAGGHWDQFDRLLRPEDAHSPSIASHMSADSFNSLESTDIITQMKKTEGIYGWCRKGAADWRVFWVGGTSSRNDVLFKET